MASSLPMAAASASSFTSSRFRSGAGARRLAPPSPTSSDEDRDGRLQAAQVAFANPTEDVTASLDQIFALVLAAAVLGGVGVAVGAGKLPVWVMLAYAMASLIAFLVYAFDKSAARRDRWRVSEQTLHPLALAGGWPGALIAQRWLRHKSKKASFRSPSGARSCSTPSPSGGFTLPAPHEQAVFLNDLVRGSAIESVGARLSPWERSPDRDPPALDDGAAAAGCHLAQH